MNEKKRKERKNSIDGSKPQLRGMDGTREVLPGPAPSPQRHFLHRVGLPQLLTTGFSCTPGRDGAFPRNTTEGKSPPRPPTPVFSLRRGRQRLRELCKAAKGRRKAASRLWKPGVGDGAGWKKFRLKVKPLSRTRKENNNNNLAPSSRRERPFSRRGEEPSEGMGLGVVLFSPMGAKYRRWNVGWAERSKVSLGKRAKCRSGAVLTKNPQILHRQEVSILLSPGKNPSDLPLLAHAVKKNIYTNTELKHLPSNDRQIREIVVKSQQTASNRWQCASVVGKTEEGSPSAALIPPAPLPVAGRPRSAARPYEGTFLGPPCSPPRDKEPAARGRGSLLFAAVNAVTKRSAKVVNFIFR